MKFQRVVEYCAYCDGTGSVPTVRFLFWQTTQTCPYCHGRGRLSVREVHTEDDERRYR